MRMLVKDLITEYSVRNKEGKAYPVYSVTNSPDFGNFHWFSVILIVVC